MSGTLYTEGTYKANVAKMDNDDTYKPTPYTSDIVSGVHDLSMGFNFKVRLNGITFGFQSVSGISVKRNADFKQEGGVNDHQIMIGMPQNDTPTLTFSRGLVLKAPQIVTTAAKAGVAYIPINEARKAAFFSLNMLDPQELLETGPALGDIEVYSTTKRGKMVGLYSFLALGISEWSLDGLNAESGDKLIETFSVIHTGITRLPVAPPIGQYYFKGDLGTYGMLDKVVVEYRSMNAPKEMTAELDENDKTKQLSPDEVAALKKKAEEEAYYMAHREPDKRAKWDKTKRLSADEIQALIDKMKEEWGDDEEESIAQKEWKKIREKGAQKAQELREIARKKAEEYVKEAQKVTELMAKSESKRLESIKERAKEFAKLAQNSERIAKRSSNELAIKLSKFRELQKEKAADLREEFDKIEQAKFSAMKACELARAMAKATRENAKELQAKNWQKIKEEHEKEILKYQEEFTQAREIGLEKTKQVKEEVSKRQAEYQKKVEEIEKKKAEFEKKRQEFMKMAQEVEDEAEETAAEAENAADDAEAMIELAG